MSERKQKPKDLNQEAADKARADLLRMQQQSENIMGAPRTEREARDEGDDVERWGKRIGFGLSMVMGVYVVWWFWDQIFN